MENNSPPQCPSQKLFTLLPDVMSSHTGLQNRPKSRHGIRLKGQKPVLSIEATCDVS